jgi:hypothetical protein
MALSFPGRWALGAACVAILLAPASPGGAADTFKLTPAFRHLLALTRGVQSTIADIEVHTKMKSFPPMSLTFRGHSYFRAPDQQSIVFDDVPGPLKGMVKDSPSIEPAPLWGRHYDVTFEASGDQTIFHLTPKAEDDPIQSADVTVDNVTGYMTHIQFNNRNGSSISNDLTYDTFGGHAFVATQQGTATGRGYKADVTTTFRNYQINVPVPDSAFETK